MGKHGPGTPQWMGVHLHHRLRDPILWTDAAQLIKTALAAAVAWVLAMHVLDISQPFLAPWAALLTVHATVDRSLRHGAAQVASAVAGVLLAFLAGTVLGLTPLSIGLVVLAGLLIGALAPLRAEATTAAATALVVLATGSSDEGPMLVARLLDTGIGIAVGLLVNLLVWPPLRDRSAARQVDAIDDRLGALIGDVAARLRRGRDALDVARALACCAELDGAIGEAIVVVRQARESGRFNARRATARRIAATGGYADVLARLELAVAEVRSMLRTIEFAHIAPDDWDPRFREPWLDLLARTGRGVEAGDAGALVAVRGDLEQFVRALPLTELPEGFWPVCGALVVNLRNVLEALDVVADVQPIRVPKRPRAMVHAG